MYGWTSPVEPIPHAGRRLLRLRVYQYRGSVEVYVNGGKQVMSSYSYASKAPRAIRLRIAESGLTVTRRCIISSQSA